MFSLTMMLYESWKNRLSQDYPQEHDSIATWLMRGLPQSPSLHLSSSEMTQLLNYRYTVLYKRYLNQPAKQGYKRLINRLSALILKHPSIEPKFNQTPRHQQFIVRLTQQVVEDLLHHDPEVQKTLNWIEECTTNPQLREAFTFASLEEYCCQPVNCQPLLLQRLRRVLEQESSLAA